MGSTGLDWCYAPFTRGYIFNPRICVPKVQSQSNRLISPGVILRYFTQTGQPRSGFPPPARAVERFRGEEIASLNDCVLQHQVWVIQVCLKGA